MSAFVTLSEAYPLETTVAVALLALATLIGLQLIAVRWRWTRSQKAELALRARWRPVLALAITGGKMENLPALAVRERPGFMQLWLHLRSMVHGAGGNELDAIATRLGCADLGLRYLVRGRTCRRLMGILAVGYLRDRRAQSALWEVIHRSRGEIALRAAWALIQIDTGALPRLLPMMLSRTDWPQPDAVSLLKPHRDIVAREMMQAIPTLEAETLVRALKLLHALSLPPPRTTFHGLLRHPCPEVLVAALPLAQLLGLRALIGSYAGHPDWVVRLKVASLLGQAATLDLPALRRLVQDENWWVRYRAAEGIARHVHVAEHPRLLEMPDRFACDMLDRAFEEKRAQRTGVTS